jgi:hypothetical protein
MWPKFEPVPSAGCTHFQWPGDFPIDNVLPAPFEFALDQDSRDILTKIVVSDRG